MSELSVPIPPENTGNVLPTLPEPEALNLSPEQATAINRNFVIKVIGGAHSFGSDSALVDKTSKLDVLTAQPTALDYNEAASVTASLRPSDILCVEGHGSGGRRIESSARKKAQMRESLAAQTTTEGSFSSMRRRAMKQRVQAKLPERLAEERQEVERQRQEDEIDAFEYAARLAAIQGNEVIIADSSADTLADTAQQLGKPVLALNHSRDAQDEANLRQIHKQREYDAAQVVIDYALSHLAPKGTLIAPEDRRQLAVLFGAAHAESIQQLFDSVGLPAEVSQLKYTGIEDKRQAAIARIAKESGMTALAEYLEPDASTLFPTSNFNPSRFRDSSRFAPKPGEAPPSDEQ